MSDKLKKNAKNMRGGGNKKAEKKNENRKMY